MNNTNGSGNGHDPDEKKIVKFPTLAERQAAQREEKKQEEQWRKQYKTQNRVPFFNASKIPPFTRIFIAAIFIIHVGLYVFADSAFRLQTVYSLGFIPGYFTGSVQGLPAITLLGPLTHIFIHGSWMHLFFNGVMGLTLTMFFEREFGTRTTVIFFFACGLIGALTYFAFNPFSNIPIIGASGSISGLFGAMIILFHQRGMMGVIGKRGPWPLILFWLGFMIFTGFLGGGLAWEAHIGGFIGGIGLLTLMQKKRIKF